jgi:hypothetical protein
MRRVVPRPEDNIGPYSRVHKLKERVECCLWKITLVSAPLLRLPLYLTGITVLLSTAEVSLTLSVGTYTVVRVHMRISEMNRLDSRPQPMLLY